MSRNIGPLVPLAQLYERYWELLDEHMGELVPEVEALRTSIMERGEEAAEQLQLIRDNADSFMEILEARIDELTARKKRYQRIQEQAKKDLMSVMELMGVKTITLPRFTITLKPGAARTTIADLDSVPDKYKRATLKASGPDARKILAQFPGVAVVFEADKVALKELAKQGVGVVGVDFIPELTLQVRR